MLFALILALTKAPMPPTRRLRGFLEGLEAHYKRFVREVVDLTVMREIIKQQFERIVIERNHARLTTKRPIMFSSSG